MYIALKNVNTSEADGNAPDVLMVNLKESDCYDLRSVLVQCKSKSQELKKSLPAYFYLCALVQDMVSVIVNSSVDWESVFGGKSMVLLDMPYELDRSGDGWDSEDCFRPIDFAEIKFYGETIDICATDEETGVVYTTESISVQPVLDIIKKWQEQK